MEQHVTLDEAQAQLDTLIDAAMSGATILITKNGDRTVQLVPVTQSVERPIFGSGRGLMTMTDDFDEPLDDFAEYTQ
jgi:prevent-host-death family protein